MRNSDIRNEVQKRILMLKKQHEVIGKDLEVARGFLALLDREMHTDNIPRTSRTHAEIVEDAVLKMLSGGTSLHRKDILEGVLAQRIHIGNDGDYHRQLAMLSSILSRSSYFVPAGDGHWKLAGQTTNMDASTKFAEAASKLLQQTLVSEGE